MAFNSLTSTLLYEEITIKTDTEGTHNKENYDIEKLPVIFSFLKQKIKLFIFTTSNNRTRISNLYKLFLKISYNKVGRQ